MSVYVFCTRSEGMDSQMKQQESRPQVGLIISIATAVLVGVLFFMPWLSISFDMKGMVQMANPREGITLGPLPDEPLEVARTSGQQLTGGEVTVTEEAKKIGTTMSHETHMPSRTWVYAGLALPALLLLVSAMGLGGKISSVGAGKLLFLLAFTGIVMMYTVSRISYVDDMVDKALEQYDAHEPAGVPATVRAKIEQSLEEKAEYFEDVVSTKTTAMLWVTMGAYAVVCVCGVVTIGSPTPASERAIAERSARSPRRDVTRGSPTPRPSFRDRRTCPPGQLPQFGPDLFAPPDKGESD